MGFLSVIRRWALRGKMPIREIARRTGLSRNTIKKYLREDAIEPKFKTPSRPSKLDPYADRLSAWLLAQTRKSRKERRNVKLMHEDLFQLGYDGSYERVAAFAREWRADRHRAEQTTGRGTFVPLVFQPHSHTCFACVAVQREKHSSSTGAKTGPRLLENASNCRWHTPNCRTVVPSLCAPILCRRMRCCSMRTGMHSACSAAFRGEASMTARIGRHGSEARPSEDGRRSCWSRETARHQCALQSDGQPLRL